MNVVSQERDEEMLNRARIEWKEPKKKTGRLLCCLTECSIRVGMFVPVHFRQRQLVIAARRG